MPRSPSIPFTPAKFLAALLAVYGALGIPSARADDTALAAEVRAG